jgi:hypothetical protein
MRGAGVHGSTTWKGSVTVGQGDMTRRMTPGETGRERRAAPQRQRPATARRDEHHARAETVIGRGAYRPNVGMAGARVELPARSDASPSWARPPCSGRGSKPPSRPRRIVQTCECSTSCCESPRGGAVDRGSAGGCSAGAVWGLPCRCRRLSRLHRRARCSPSVDTPAFAALASAAALNPTPKVGHETAERVCGAWLRVTRVRSAS